MIKKRRASTVVFFVIFFTSFLAFSALAVDGTIIYMIRGKLQNATEATALAAASEFNSSASVTATDIELAAKNTFKLLKTDNLQYASINVEVSLNNKEVRVTTTMPAQTYFLRILGVASVQLNAKSCAKSEALNITASYGKINWITASAAYLSDILSKDLNLNDTAIMTPLGNFPSASYDTTTGYVKFDLLDYDTTNQPLSLGPGGFITIKMPTPIIDKPGNDLFIKEIGALEGYFVFAGLDNDPANPYVNYNNTGAGLKWINISCTGTPEKTDSDGRIGAYEISDTNLGTQAKFYGSGYFDIGATCTNGFKGISMAKYIRIVDDNDESAFVTNSIGTINSSKYYMTKIYGEASTPTAGADIDYVQLLNHVKLIQPSAFVPD